MINNPEQYRCNLKNPVNMNSALSKTPARTQKNPEESLVREKNP